MRCFIAVDLPHLLKEEINSHVIGELRKKLEGIRWVGLDGIHITLKFLGEVPESDIPRISEVLSHTIKGIPKFSLLIGGLGGFPSINNPRVIWIGVEGDIETLNNLHRNIEDEFSKLGFKRDREEFVPHVTLGRVKKARGNIGITLRSFSQSPKFPSFEVSDVKLFKSTLTPDGAIYNVLKSFKLAD
jgi:2'-5' RNA ligase